MWTPETRARYDRKGLLYPSDVTDAEWKFVAPLIPPARRGGRPRTVNMRGVLNGVLYILETGCSWRHLPHDFPARSTCHGYLQLWMWDGTLERFHDALYEQLREAEGREVSPTAAVIDSQSVKSAARGGGEQDPVGYDAGKKVRGTKYHIVVDTLGLLLNVAVSAAGVQDRDGAALVLNKATRALFPFIQVIFADSGYQGVLAAAKVRDAGRWELTIVKRSDTDKGFVVLPKRWLVERTLAWLSRCRRPACHYAQASPHFPKSQ